MKKHLLLSLVLAVCALAAFCQNTPANDSLKLKIEGSTGYYMQTIRVDSGITEHKIYQRTLEFMAAKNFQQNYGYDEEGKLICTTTQDLNNNQVSPNSNDEMVDPYTVQFTITVDMKNRRYRYTINNIVFYIPDEGGNRRLTMYEMHQKATNTDSKRIAKEAQKYISSLEGYIVNLTDELYQAIEQKRAMDNTKF
jgi:YD repeat-containing protein